MRKRHKATPWGQQLPLSPGWGGLTRMKTPRAPHSRSGAGFASTERSQSARAVVPTAGIEPLPRTAVGQGTKRESRSFIFHPPQLSWRQLEGLSPSPVPWRSNLSARCPVPSCTANRHGASPAGKLSHVPKVTVQAGPPQPPEAPAQLLLPERGALPLPHCHVVHGFGEGGISAAHGHSCGHKEEQPETEDDQAPPGQGQAPTDPHPGQRGLFQQAKNTPDKAKRGKGWVERRDGGEQNHRGERCGAPRRSGEPPARLAASAEPAERHRRESRCPRAREEDGRAGGRRRKRRREGAEHEMKVTDVRLLETLLSAAAGQALRRFGIKSL